MNGSPAKRTDSTCWFLSTLYFRSMKLELAFVLTWATSVILVEMGRLVFRLKMNLAKRWRHLLVRTYWFLVIQKLALMQINTAAL